MNHLITICWLPCWFLCKWVKENNFQLRNSTSISLFCWPSGTEMIFQNISHRFRACYANWFLSHAWSSLLTTQILQILLEALLTDFQLESKMRVFWSAQPQVEPSSAPAQASIKRARLFQCHWNFFSDYVLWYLQYFYASIVKQRHMYM